MIFPANGYPAASASVNLYFHKHLRLPLITNNGKYW